MINRVLFYDKIKIFIDKPLIRVITGIRRSGKSTLLKQISKRLSGNGVHEDNLVIFPDGSTIKSYIINN